MSDIIEVSEESFDQVVLQSDLPALVDFWGDHCPACRQIAPILDELADDYAGRLRIFKVHATENPRISARFGVRAMPTVLGFASGEVLGELVGARPKKAFEELIERLG
jgi:thioredoxin 1